MDARFFDVNSQTLISREQLSSPTYVHHQSSWFTVSDNSLLRDGDLLFCGRALDSTASKPIPFTPSSTATNQLSPPLLMPKIQYDNKILTLEIESNTKLSICTIEDPHSPHFTSQCVEITSIDDEHLEPHQSHAAYNSEPFNILSQPLAAPSVLSSDSPSHLTPRTPWKLTNESIIVQRCPLNTPPMTFLDLKQKLNFVASTKPAAPVSTVPKVPVQILSTPSSSTQISELKENDADESSSTDDSSDESSSTDASSDASSESEELTNEFRSETFDGNSNDVNGRLIPPFSLNTPVLSKKHIRFSSDSEDSDNDSSDGAAPSPVEKPNTKRSFDNANSITPSPDPIPSSQTKKNAHFQGRKLKLLENGRSAFSYPILNGTLGIQRVGIAKPLDHAPPSPTHFQNSSPQLQDKRQCLSQTKVHNRFHQSPPIPDLVHAPQHEQFSTLTTLPLISSNIRFKQLQLCPTTFRPTVSPFKYAKVTHVDSMRGLIHVEYEKIGQLVVEDDDARGMEKSRQLRLPRHKFQIEEQENDSVVEWSSIIEPELVISC